MKSPGGMKMRKIDRRSLQAQAGTGNTLEGVAVPYGNLRHVLNDRARPYRERFQRGAIQSDSSTLLLYGHDMNSGPLARVGAGTLTLEEREDGLHFSAQLPESRADIIDALRRGDLDGSVSIGFIANDDTWNNKTNPAVRTVRAATLIEVSIVPSGAYPDASGDLK